MVWFKCHFADPFLPEGRQVVQSVAQFGNTFIKLASEFHTVNWSDSGQIEVSWGDNPNSPRSLSGQKTLFLAQPLTFHQLGNYRANVSFTGSRAQDFKALD
jgi:hypothetical protein